MALWEAERALRIKALSTHTSICLFRMVLLFTLEFLVAFIYLFTYLSFHWVLLIVSSIF